MKNLLFNLKQPWSGLWQAHHQMKAFIRLDFSSIYNIESGEKEEDHDPGEQSEVSEEEIIPGGTPDKSSGDKSGGGGGGMETGEFGMRQRIGLFLGPLLFLAALLMPTPAEMSPDAQKVLASTLWIACWWVTEAIPIPVTSLMPIILFPLTGALSVANATAPYANHNVFLFLGGFTVAVCMQRWNLHRRIALHIIYVMGTSPSRLILGFMLATAFLSMWISNTATSMMMVPIGLAVILQVAKIISKQKIEGIDVRQGHFNFGTCLMLSIAYAASIGGMATLIGTPPNIIFAGVVEEMFEITISFARWFSYGLPISTVFLLIAWQYMVKFAYPPRLKEIPGGRDVVKDELKNLGAVSREEKTIAAVFLFVALAWLSRSFLLEAIFPEINDAAIAITGAVITFLIPVNLKEGRFLNNWSTAVKLPWGILLLFGGGLSLAGAFSETGLAKWIGMRLSAVEELPMILIMFAVVAMVIYLTEFTSNTATTSMMMPIMAAMASAMFIHPYALMITATTATSFAFMLPVATPPNAVIFGSGYVSIPQMARAGFLLNILGVIMIALAAYLWLPLAWGIDIHVFPEAWR